MINITNFDPNLLKIDRKSNKNIDIYYIGYITRKDSDYVKMKSVNPLYVIISEMDGHFECNSIEEKNGNKYLTLDSINKNKEVIKKYAELWNGNKNKIVTLNGGKPGESGKDFIKIKFNSDHNLLLNKTLRLQLDSKFYPQFFSDKCLYKL